MLSCLAIASAQNQSGAVIKRFKALEYFDPPHELQMKSYLEGAEAEPQGNGLILRNSRLQTFGTNGAAEMTITAPQCFFDKEYQTVNSAGPFRMRMSNDVIWHEGVGFFWKKTNSELFISNSVRTTQMNLISPTPSTNAAPLVRTAPSDIRPSEVHSRSWHANLRSNLLYYIDDVHVDNPQLQSWSRFLTLEAPKLPSGKFNRVTAETNVVIDFVRYIPPNLTTNHATCDKAVDTSIITNVATLPAVQWLTSHVAFLYGNPAVVTNNQGVIRGNPIIWDRLTDDISTPNLDSMEINPGQTNTSSFSTKGNAPAK